MSKNEIETLLSKEIVGDISQLATTKAGSDEKAKIIDELTKLHKLRVEEIKVNVETDEKYNQQELERDKHMLNTIVHDDEQAYKEAQHKEMIKDRRIQRGLAVVPLIAYDIWQRRGFNFEINNTVCSSWLRNLISKVTPKLK